MYRSGAQPGLMKCVGVQSRLIRQLSAEKDNFLKTAVLHGSPGKGNTADMAVCMGMENAGIITAAGDENGSEAKHKVIRNSAKFLNIRRKRSNHGR